MTTPPVVVGTPTKYQAGAAGSSTATMTKPTGLADGDLLVAFVHQRTQAASTWTVPTAFQQALINTTNHQWGVWVKPVTDAASEPSSYAFTVSAAASRMAGVLFVVRGANTSQPVDASAVGTQAYTGATTLPSVTTVAPNALLLGFAAAVQQTSASVSSWTVDAAMTEVVEAIGGTAGTAASDIIVAGSETRATPGATGTRTFTVSPTVTNSGGGLLSIAPATDGPSAPVVTAPEAVTGVEPGSTVSLSFTEYDANGDLDPTTRVARILNATNGGECGLVLNGNTVTFEAPYTVPGTQLTIGYYVGDTAGYYSPEASVTVDVLPASERIVVTGGVSPLEYALRTWVGTPPPLLAYVPQPDPPANPVDPPPATGSAFITAEKSLTLPTSGNGYTRALGIANSLKAGTLTPNLDSVDTKDGSTALTGAIFWLSTGKTDTALLAALKTFILAAPGTNLDATQALNPMRGIGSLLMAVDILIKNGGGWDGSASCPNLPGGASFDTWLNGGGTGTPGATNSLADPLEDRILGTANMRWPGIKVTAIDSANNWGSVARYALLAIAIVRDDATLLALAIDLFKRYLGDQTVAQPFNEATDYLPGWDNTGAAGTGVVNAGIGLLDTVEPGKDGVVVDDINRGHTDYNATADYYGASASGLTYPPEAADYVWATAAALYGLGHTDVFTWSDNAIIRMGDWFDRAKDSLGVNVYSYIEGKFSIYRNHRWFGNYFKGGTDPYGAGMATTATLARALPYGDWICGAGSTWCK